MDVLRIVLLSFLIICALAVSFSKRLLVSVSIYMAFSLVMAIIWLLLESPDLAITEAAVGAGVISILLFITLKKIRSIRTEASNETKPEV
ncbi:hydrogenase subunit MbhD domain-containing protein [Butyrivibrio sp. AE2032]|uniref:hydrogenase subunit MbhD domain-containing protein n=1 Tax=Butyrivibrio sp. AE2032 TaxID=1458463 RepID=UPI000555ACA4|nr:hydrogenase subunit MbhD domain-containing protein [Butyrivibrio sp. AE2032]